MGSRGKNFSLFFSILIFLFTVVLLLGPNFGIFLLSGDWTEEVEVVSYNLDTQMVDHQYFNLTTPHILASSYYETNGSSHISYLTTGWKELNQDDFDINITLVNRDLASGESERTILYSGIVNHAIDRFAYIGMELLSSNHSSDPIFATVFRQNSRLYYQTISTNGSILESTEILQDVTGYFNYETFNQKSDTLITFMVGKELSDNTHATHRHIVEYNLTSHSISNEIEMEYEISSNILTESGIVAMYTDEAGEWNNIGLFDDTGKLVTTYGVMEGRIQQQIDPNHILLIRNLNDANNIQSFINYGYIGLFVIIVILIFYQTWLNKQSDKQESNPTTEYLN